MKTLGTKVNDDMYQQFQELSAKQDVTISENLRNLVEGSLTSKSTHTPKENQASDDIYTTLKSDVEEQRESNEEIKDMADKTGKAEHNKNGISWKKVLIAGGIASGFVLLGVGLYNYFNTWNQTSNYSKSVLQEHFFVL